MWKNVAAGIGEYIYPGQVAIEAFSRPSHFPRACSEAIRSAQDAMEGIAVTLLKPFSGENKSHLTAQES